MLIGYARTSTLEQEAGLAAQVRDLTALGCEKIVAEQTSAVGPRPKLDELLEFMRSGDVFTVTKIDRLARSVLHLSAIVEQLKAKGVELRIVGSGIDTTTPNGKLMLNVLGSVAEFERDMMLERQREGIAKAKAEGRYKGRSPTARAKADEVRELTAAGASMGEVAKRLGIGKGSVHRILKTSKEADAAI